LKSVLHGEGAKSVRVEEMLGEIAVAVRDLKTTGGGTEPSSLSTVNESIGLLREELATSMVAILVYIGRVDEKLARKWVESTLLPEESA
jgi:hypothetical protein